MRSLWIMALLAVLAASPAAAAPRVIAGVTEAWGIAVDSQSNIYVSDSISRIYKITQSGSVTVLASGLSSPWGLAVDANDNLFIALNRDSTTVIDEIPAGTSTVEPFLLKSTLPVAAAGLTFDAQGNLFFTGSAAGGVYEIPSGTSTPVTVGEGFADAVGIAVDASGNVFVSRYSFNEIDEIPARAARPVSFDSTLIYASGLNGPAGLVFDAAGDLLVSIFGSNTVGTSVDIIHAGSVAPASATPLVTGLSQPEFLAYRFGTLYIANSGGGQVLVNASPIPALSSWATAIFALLAAACGWRLIHRKHQAGRRGPLGSAAAH
jgi:glucose/arabinose dehydrogenase